MPEEDLAAALRLQILVLGARRHVAKAAAKNHREEWPWLAAYITKDENMVSVSHFATDEDEGDGQAYAIRSEVDVEHAVIFKDCLEHLSDDARQVAGLILNTPQEVEDLITTAKHGWLSKASMAGFLHAYFGWEETRIGGAFREITEMLRGI
jgi:hypothetical protein